MINSEKQHPKQFKDAKNTSSILEPKTAEKQNKGLSMHEGIPVWYDCCSCEAEPYWTESMEQHTSK